MNQVLGQIGGFMMLVLIVVLACRFALDMGWIAYRTTLRRFYGFGMLALAAGVCQLGFGALVCNLAEGQTNAFDMQTIWKDAGVQAVIGSDAGGGLYPLLVRGLGKILFGETVAVAFYISMACAVCITWCSYLLLYKSYSKQKLRWCVIALLLFPGSFYLFLPTKVTLWLCLSLWEFLLLRKGKKIAAAVFALLALWTSVFGVISVGMFLCEILLMKEKRSGQGWLAAYTALLVAAVLIQILSGGKGGFEWLLLLLPYLYLPLQTDSIEKHGNRMTCMWILFALGNGFLVCLR